METRLRVMHVVLSMDVGGLERIVLDLTREGQKIGQRMAVACVERAGTLAPQVEAAGARVICVDKPPGTHPAIVGRMAAAIRRFRPDVVHTHQVGALFYTGPAARAAGTPVVVHTEHGKHYAGRRRTQWLGRVGGWFVQRFFCVSKDIAEEVLAHRIVAPRKVAVVANGIDTARFQTGPDGPASAQPIRTALGVPMGAPLIGTIGRLSEVKRQDVLIRGFARVRDRLSDAHLLLVGDGPLRGELERLATRLGLAERVHFAGYQPDPERYLRAMDVFALTSRSEGMPLVILETWAAGIPVVASSVGGLPELIEDGRTGLFFPPADEAALADRLFDVAADPDLARRLAVGGRNRVESLYTLHQTAMKYQAHYLELLSPCRMVA